MANQLNINEMDAAQLKAALEALQNEAIQARKALKAAQEKERAAKKAAQEAEKALKARPSGVLVKLAESLLSMSKERTGGKLPAYGGTDGASLGKRASLCIEKGFTKKELLPVLLKALGKDEAHPDAPNHEATIHAQLPTRIQSRLEPMGYRLAKARGEGQTEMRFLLFSIPVEKKA